MRDHPWPIDVAGARGTSAVSLDDYTRKRRFDRTPEPGADTATTRGARDARAPIFVVQLHHASHRHYDFRLEADGVLKSWAVPKGPSMRVGEKRLAVEVEDHPLGYATFEGDIPQGQYGGGHVDVFDSGTWHMDGDPLTAIAAGKLEFELRGDVLRGAWKMIRTAKQAAKPQWLLFKRDDAHARDAESDDFVEAQAARRASGGKRDVAGTRNGAGSATTSRPRTAKRSQIGPAKHGVRAGTRPRREAIDWALEAAALDGARPLHDARLIGVQLATLRESAPEGDGWLHELKWDGYRMVSLVVDDQVALRSRNGLNWSNDFPDVSAALQALGVPQAQFDGELVAFNAAGHVDFGALQSALKAGADAPVRYVLFDMPLLAGIDLTRTRLIDRKALLERVLAGHADGVLAYSAHIVGHGTRVYETSKGQQVEGILSKAIDAPYQPGRSSTWVKVKHLQSDDFVVIGFTPGKGGRGGLGALLLATRGEDGALRYVGRVGTGFDTASLAAMTRRLNTLKQSAPVLNLPAHVVLPRRSIAWVEPRTVVEIEFRGWGNEGLLRQGSFKRVRDDKPVKDVGGDRRSGEAAGTGPARSTRIPSTPPRPRRGRARTDALLARITSPAKVIYPTLKLAKADVAAYYAEVAPLLLPEVVNRPLSLLRCPDGSAGTCFFQKHHAATLGAAVHAVPIAEKDGGTDDYLFIDDVEGLLALVQMNALELHPWGSRIANVECPDRLVFDLDPGPGVTWKAVLQGARDVRDRLADVGLASFVRLSGGKGVHVVAPIRPGPDWTQAKAFCGAFADAMAVQRPDRYVATATKAKRNGVIFIDWLRNGRGATSVCSWSLRAREQAGVAVPLAWDELDATRSGADYPLPRALERARSGDADPWNDGWRAATRQVLKLG